MKKNSLVFITVFWGNILLFCILSNAQVIDNPTQVLRRIGSMQVKSPQGAYPGIFPTYISKSGQFSKKREDQTIFYAALVAVGLKDLLPKMTVEEKLIADSIISQVVRAYPYFKNVGGKESYNYWPSSADYNFPFKKEIPFAGKKRRLSDDPDCTAVCLMALRVDDSSAKQAHAIMQQYVNDPGKSTKTVPPAYRKFKGYSGWYWEGMPVVNDVCTLSNILCFVQEYGLSWTRADSSSLDFVLQVIDREDFIKIPQSISPYYGEPAVILYFIARLMNLKPIAALEQRKPLLVDAALKLLEGSKVSLEKILLLNALVKWNAKIQWDPGDIRKEIEESSYSIVVANMSSFLPHFLNKNLSKRGVGMIHYFCPAYNDVLWLEFLLSGR